MRHRNGTILVKLPYPVKIGFITFSIKRKIGFSFDQRGLFNLLHNNNIDLPNHSKWLKETPKNVIVFETLFASAQSYCMELRVKDNFTKKGLSKAIFEADEPIVNEIMQCWKDSESFGFKRIPGKKKAVKL